MGRAWFRLEIKTLDVFDVKHVSDQAVRAWFRLAAYCVGQENGGILKDTAKLSVLTDLLRGLGVTSKRWDELVEKEIITPGPRVIEVAIASACSRRAAGRNDHVVEMYDVHGEERTAHNRTAALKGKMQGGNPNGNSEIREAVDITSDKTMDRHSGDQGDRIGRSGSGSGSSLLYGTENKGKPQKSETKKGKLETIRNGPEPDRKGGAVTAPPLPPATYVPANPEPDPEPEPIRWDRTHARINGLPMDSATHVWMDSATAGSKLQTAIESRLEAERQAALASLQTHRAQPGALESQPAAREPTAEPETLPGAKEDAFNSNGVPSELESIDTTLFAAKLSALSGISAILTDEPQKESENEKT